MAESVRYDVKDDDGKRAKTSVDYKMGGPHCHACRFFVEDESGSESERELGWCKLVAGAIDGHAVCNLFEWRKFIGGVR